jgi:uncharacterized protein YndB with AHSA1/START domain
MTTIYHQVGIKAALSDVYRAIATTDGIGHWWTRTSGNPGAGGDLEFSFDDIAVIAKVTANETDRYVEWTVGGKQGEWLNTRICFRLDEQDDQIMVNFEHAGWREATEMLAHCSTKWAVFLLSLKEYLETGSGKPYPHDTPINHTVFG